MQIRDHHDHAGRKPPSPLAGPEEIGRKKMRGDNHVEDFAFQPPDEGLTEHQVPRPTEGLDHGIDAGRIKELEAESPDRSQVSNEEVVHRGVESREEARFKRQDIPALHVRLRELGGGGLRDRLSGSAMTGTGSGVRDEDADGNDYAGSLNRRNRS